MSLSPQNSPAQSLDPPAADPSSAFKIFGIKLAEIDKEDVLNRGIDTVKILGIRVAEVEKEHIRWKRIHEEQIMRPRVPSGMDVVWTLLNSGSFCTMLFYLNYFNARWISMIYKISPQALNSCFSPVFVGQMGCAVLLQKKRFGMPKLLIGRVWRAVGDGIALVAAIILRKVFPYDGNVDSINAIIILVSLTLHLHSWLQVLHQAEDISLDDVLLENMVQSAICISTGHDIICSFIVLLFLCVICYKYMYYSVPNSLENIKKDVELPPV